MELMDRLNQIFCEVFDDDDIKITSETTANDIDGWDSLSHINLIVAIETKFDIRFKQKEVMSFKHVGDLFQCIQSKLLMK
jgi:acyl carrier protein